MNIRTLIRSISKGIKKALSEGEALPIDSKYQENMYSEIDIKKPNTKFTVNYVFDDLEQIPFEERQYQYEMPISTFARASGFGYKISALYEGNTNAPNKTYSPKDIISIIKKMFQLADWQVKYYIYNGCNNIQCACLIGDLYDNKESVIKVMDAYGWSYAMTDDKILLQNQNWIVLHFDPIFQNDVNEEIKQYPILFHWTPSYRYENILKEGLIPKSDNYMFSYPPKIHLIKGFIKDLEIINIGQQLCNKNVNAQNNGHYVLLDVDTRKIKEDIDFFYDPRYEHGYYTKQSINKEALAKNKEINFKQS